MRGTRRLERSTRGTNRQEEGTTTKGGEVVNAGTPPRIRERNNAHAQPKKSTVVGGKGQRGRRRGKKRWCGTLDPNGRGEKNHWVIRTEKRNGRERGGGEAKTKGGTNVEIVPSIKLQKFGRMFKGGHTNPTGGGGKKGKY